MVIDQQSSQIVNNRDGACSEFPFGISLADEQFGSDSAFRVNVIDRQGASLIDTATAVEADTKQSAITVGLESGVKQPLYLGFAVNNALN